MQGLKRSVRRKFNPVVQIAKRQLEFQSMFGSSAKKELFAKISAGRKDSCFLLANNAVAFVKDMYDTYQCEVIKSKHIESVSDSSMQSSLLNIFLYSKKCKRRLHNKIVTKKELVRKCVCLPEKRGLAIFPLLYEFEKK